MTALEPASFEVNAELKKHEDERQSPVREEANCGEEPVHPDDFTEESVEVKVQLAES